jgi:hypothetical protein
MTSSDKGRMKSMAQAVRLKLENLYRNYFLILLSGLVVVFWFRGNYLIDFWDQTLPLNPISGLAVYSQSWFSTASLGFPAGQTLTFIPYFALVSFWTMFSLPLWVSEALVYYAIFVSAGAGMTYLFRTLFKRATNWWIPQVSGLFYMFNVYAMVFMWRVFSTNVFAYSFMPWALGLFLKGIRQDNTKGLLKYTLLFAVAGFLSVPGFELFPIEILVFCSFLLYSLKTRFQPIKKQIFNAVAIIASWMLLNLWWVLPLYGGLSGTVSEYQSFGTTFLFVYNSSNTTIPNLLLISGWSPLYQALSYPSTYAWSRIYQPESASVLSLIAILIPVTVALSVALSFKVRSHLKEVATILGIMVFGLIGAEGSQAPFSSLNQFSYNHLPYSLQIDFRDVGLQFGLALVFAISLLFALGLHYVQSLPSFPSNRLIKRSAGKILAIGIIIAVVGVYFWPMWTGDAMPPLARVQIPSAYSGAVNFLSSDQSDYRIVSLPTQNGVLELYDWQHGVAGPPIFQQFGIPTISSDTGVPAEDGIITSVNRELYTNNASALAKVWGILNAKYIVLEDDKNWTDNTYGNQTTTDFLVNHLTGIEPVWNDGPVTIYKNSFWYNPIYVTGSVLTDNYSMAQPAQVSEISAFNNWPIEGSSQSVNFTAISSGFDLAMKGTPGAYAYTYLTSPQPLAIPTNAEYIEMRFKTSDLGSVLLQAQESNGQNVWLYALNPPLDSTSNHYDSTDWYTIFYDLPANGVTSPIENLSIYLTDKIGLSGPAQLSVDYIRFDSDIGSTSDQIRLMMGSDMIPNQTTFFSSQNQLAPIPSSLLDELAKLGPSPEMSYEEISPTEYIVQITNAENPFVLVLGSLFNEGWQAWVADAQASQHFTVNLGMNAWIVSKQGSFTIDVRFAEQSVVITSAIISVSTVILLTIIFVTVSIRRRTKTLREHHE